MYILKILILFNNLAATKIIKSKPNAILNLFKIFILHESVHITVCKIYKFPSLNMTRITAKQLRENLSKQAKEEA